MLSYLTKASCIFCTFFHSSTTLTLIVAFFSFGSSMYTIWKDYDLRSWNALACIIFITSIISLALLINIFGKSLHSSHPQT
jgi:uncharacterized membrane protein